jgi:CBS domain-containing protein
MANTVGELVRERSAIAVSRGTSVREAARKMLEYNVGAVVILENDHLEGIFTERDALKFFVATRRNADVTDVCETMTPAPITVDPSTDLQTAQNLMLAGNFRHLPVVLDGAVIGVVSLRELANHLA